MSLRELLTQIRARTATEMNSGQVRHQIVIPILRELGWDDSDPDQVDFDYTVQSETFSSLVDIVLRRGWDHVVHVALCRDESEFEGIAELAFKAAVIDQVPFVIVTSPNRWQCYLARRDRDVAQMRFADFDLHSDPLDELANTLSNYLEPAQWLNQRAVPAAESALADRVASLLAEHVPRALSALVGSADEMLVELLQDHVERASGARPHNEDVVDLLRRLDLSVRIQPATTPAAPFRSGAHEPSAVAEATASSMSQTTVVREPTPRVGSGINVQGSRTKTPPRRTYRSGWWGALPPVTGFSLFGEERKAATYAALAGRVAEMVYQRHANEFDRVMQIRGNTRKYYSQDPQDLDAPRRIVGSDYYIETKFNSHDMVRRCHRLLELFGYRESELEIYFD